MSAETLDRTVDDTHRDEPQPTMVIANESTVYDVVFVVEGTASLGGYFDAIKTNYILPTLE